MMHGMAATPVVVRCQGQHDNRATCPVIHPPAAKEGPVTAIVLDHEQSHEEAGSGHRDSKANEIAPAEGGARCHPEQRKWDNRDNDFDEAAQMAWRTVPI